MSTFIDILLSATTVPLEIEELLRRHIVQKSIVKGTVLQKSGDLKHKTYFVNIGLLSSYSIDEKGKKHIFMFAPENWVVSDIDSQAYDSPAVLFIDALEDSTIEIIDNELFNILDHLPNEIVHKQVRTLFRRVAALQRRVLMLMSASATQRYQEFTKTYPGIVERVPQHMIASYLGITPESLSYIRGKIARG